MTDQKQPETKETPAQPVAEETNTLAGVSAAPLAKAPTSEEPKTDASKIDVQVEVEVEAPEKEALAETPVSPDYKPLTEENDEKVDTKKTLDSNLPDNNTPVTVDEETANEAFSSVQQYLDSQGIRNAYLRELAEKVEQDKNGAFINLKDGGKLSFQTLPDEYGRPTEFIGLKGRKMNVTDEGLANAAMVISLAREKGWNSIEVSGNKTEKDAMWLANYKINQGVELENKAIAAENETLPEAEQKPLHKAVEINNHRPSEKTLAIWAKEGKMDAPEELGPGVSESKFTDVKPDTEAGQKPETKPEAEPEKVEPAAVEYAAEDEQEAFMTEIGEDIEQTKASLLKMTAENAENPTAVSKGKCDQQMGELKQKLSTIENLHDHLKTGDRMEKGHFDNMKSSYKEVRDYKTASDFSATKTAPKQDAPKLDASKPAAPSQENEATRPKLKVKLKSKAPSQ